MKYIIELQMADGGWERSWPFAKVYTMDEAQGLLDNEPSKMFNYRITPLVEPARKSYRRHASITQLELRGAIAMLDSANKRIVTRHCAVGGYQDHRDAVSIVIDAKLAVTRQLETL
jgi:hypothetical protein